MEEPIQSLELPDQITKTLEDFDYEDPRGILVFVSGRTGEDNEDFTLTTASFGDISKEGALSIIDLASSHIQNSAVEGE